MMRCFFVLIGLLAAVAGDAVQYKIRDLGVLTAKSSQPTSINDEGDVIGLIKTGDAHQVFLWNDKTGLNIIKGLPKTAYPLQINNKGQIVGIFWSLDGWFVQKWVKHAFLYSIKDGYKDLGSIDGKNTYAASIDDAGNILLFTQEGQCYLWSNGKKMKLEGVSQLALAGEYYNIAMNNQGQIAFLQKKPDDKKSPLQASLYNCGTKEMIPFLKDVKGVPYISSINDQGTIAGFYKTAKGEVLAYFANANGSNETVSHFEPSSINQDGAAVGRLTKEIKYRGGFYKDGALQDIHDMMLPFEQQPIAYEIISNLTGINNKGQIIAVIQLLGNPHAVLLEPEGN